MTIFGQPKGREIDERSRLGLTDAVARRRPRVRSTWQCRVGDALVMCHALAYPQFRSLAIQSRVSARGGPVAELARSGASGDAISYGQGGRGCLRARHTGETFTEHLWADPQGRGLTLCPGQRRQGSSVLRGRGTEGIYQDVLVHEHRVSGHRRRTSA
jgi:hypothetical protein